MISKAEVKDAIQTVIDANDQLNSNMKLGLDIVKIHYLSLSLTGFTWVVVGVGTFLILNALNND